MSIAFALLLESGLLAAATPLPVIEEVTVVARRQEPLTALALSVTAMEPASGEPLSAHANELLDAVPGTWISRGSGQEHLTAIRSPVLTGAGACGAFLILENDLPIRPAGLCNVNNLFELNLERARRVEVLRGPGSAVHGGNALHGALNAVMPAPGESAGSANLMLGSDDYRRLDIGLDIGLDSGLQAPDRSGGWRMDGTAQSAGSFRDDEGYDQQKINIGIEHEWGAARVSHHLAATNLNQETAGFILGFEAYRDPALRTANLNPEAFRDAHALRASSRFSWQQGGWEQRLTPFARSSRMRFRQHFLPGKPLEDNGQDSAGLQWLWSRQGRLDIDMGIDLEWADIELVEFQDSPTEGSAFLQATRPVGFHYDFQVDQYQAAVHARARWAVGDGWTLEAGMRAESIEYRYDNRMLDGNTTDDGRTCGFGGCLYTRPSDRRDRFDNIAPKLAVLWQGDNQGSWLRVARGFRPPQVTELYRLQRGQLVADLDSEVLDAAEWGWRGGLPRGGRGSVVVFYQNKRNFIFRDAGGFNVSDGRTRHRGLELALRQPLAAAVVLDLNYTLARHSYVSASAISETVTPGNRVDTAPDRLGRLAIDWAPRPDWMARLEWLHQGAYYLDAANRHRYDGHDLLNLSVNRELASWQVGVRVANALNRRYAERADFAFGNYRYFPGNGRSLMVTLSYQSPQ